MQRPPHASDAAPFWMVLAAGVAGLALGDVVAVLAGWSERIGELGVAPLVGCVLLQAALALGWRLTRPRRLAARDGA